MASTKKNCDKEKATAHLEKAKERRKVAKLTATVTPTKQAKLTELNSKRKSQQNDNYSPSKSPCKDQQDSQMNDDDSEVTRVIDNVDHSTLAKNRFSVLRTSILAEQVLFSSI